MVNASELPTAGNVVPYADVQVRRADPAVDAKSSASFAQAHAGAKSPSRHVRSKKQIKVKGPHQGSAVHPASAQLMVPAPARPAASRQCFSRESMDINQMSSAISSASMSSVPMTTKSPRKKRAKRSRRSSLQTGSTEATSPSDPRCQLLLDLQKKSKHKHVHDPPRSDGVANTVDMVLDSSLSSLDPIEHESLFSPAVGRTRAGMVRTHSFPGSPVESRVPHTHTGLAVAEVTPATPTGAETLAWFRDKVRQETACRDFCFYGVLFGVFIGAAMFHVTNELVRGIEIGMQTFLEQKPNFGFHRKDTIAGQKDIYDVETSADLYSWLRIGLFPTLYLGEFEYDEVAIRARKGHAQTEFEAGELPTHVTYPGFQSPSPKKGDYKTYNTILGGIRMYQTYRPKGACRIPDAIKHLSPEPCYPTTQAWNRKWAEHRGSALDADLGDRDDADVRFAKVEDFPWSLPYAQWDRKLKAMAYGCASLNLHGANCSSETSRSEPWITPATSQVVVSFLSLNREVSIWTMTRIHFIYTRGGNIWQKIDINSVWVDPYRENNGIKYTLDILNILMFVYLFICLFARFTDWCYRRRTKGIQIHVRDQVKYSTGTWVLQGCVRFMSHFVMTIDFFLFVAGTSAMAQWYDHVLDLSNMRYSASTHLPTNAEKRDDSVKAWFDGLGVEDGGVISGHSVHYLRSSIAVTILFLMTALLKSFHLHPRLSFVTRTLMNIMGDLFHFLLVQCAAFFAFAIAGNALFGSHAYEFATLLESAMTLYLIWFGDNYWEVFERSGPQWVVVLYFVTYTVIMVLLLLNMVLAMIVDSYGEIQKNVTTQEPIHVSTSQMMLSWFNVIRKREVGMRAMYRALLEDATERGQSIMRRRPSSSRFARLFRLLALDESNILPRDYITAEELVQLVPKLPMAQAKVIIAKIIASKMAVSQGDDALIAMIAKQVQYLEKKTEELIKHEEKSRESSEALVATLLASSGHSDLHAEVMRSVRPNSFITHKLLRLSQRIVAARPKAETNEDAMSEKSSEAGNTIASFLMSTRDPHPMRERFSP
eukprot:GEMP01004136.1.p1 GENE.GEMP01004136.1~~GEMP01004136.1.p1  ORF type:complete len:1049 (+),score=178.31 GEMP01004136.1:125-3271(+)